ncbi:MAG TPA: hypothetical protein VFF06_09140 [Polyangia bacterium]|nr:hypothetical protein [Polyangia bacterium]
MSDRDRPKKSWREIDAGRDRAGGSSRTPGGARPGPSADRSSKQYRAALDALFEKGEVGKLAEKLSAPPPARSMPTPPATEPAAAEPPSMTARRAPAAEPAPKANPADEARAVLRKKILAALGRDEISRAVDRYVKAHGLPPDFEVLEQALEHQKPERVGEVLDALDGLLDREKPKRSRTLAGKLRFIEETSDDADLKARAVRIRAKLA